MGGRKKKMIDIRVEPITVDIQPFDPDDGTVLVHGDERTEGPCYWALFVDDRYVSHVSSRELAESGKQWLEKWFEEVR